MARTKSPTPAKPPRDRIAREMTIAETLGLIADPAMAKSVETNLELLESHYAIVLAVYDTLEGGSH